VGVEGSAIPRSLIEFPPDDDQKLERADALRRMTALYREHMHANEPVHERPLP
jgi:hypothetical protein